MRRLGLLVLMIGIWTCSDSGPTAPKVQLPTVQNIEFTLEEDTSKTFAFMGSDPLSRALTYSVSTQPQHGTITINAGAGTYTPNANYHGADSFAYIATNVDGSSNIGTIVATVTPVDDEPNSMDVSATTDEDNAIDITLQAEEVDGDNIEFQVRNNPSNGSVSISGTTATYTPNENWNGTDTFNFEAVDSSARSVLNVATATITVNPVNDAPTVVDVDAGEIQSNESIDITLQGSDVDNDNLTYSIVGQPSYGTVSINGSIATYNATSAGEDSFAYQASDGTESSNQATISITVKGGWSKTYGGTNDDLASSVIHTSDGGYLLGGRTKSFGNGSEDMYIVKTDASGTEEWSKTFGGIGEEAIYSFIQTSDGGYLLGGYTLSFGNGAEDMYIVKIDASGTEEWSKNFGGTTYDYANSVIQTSDGGYLIGGHTSSFGNGSSDMYLVKTDASGNEEWSKTLGGRGNEQAYSVIQTSDGGYLLGGQIGRIEDGSSDMYLVKTDANGNEEWSKTFGGTESESLNSIIQSSDGGYLLGGFTGSDANGQYDTYIVKTDANGNEEWSKKFGGVESDFVSSVIQTSDGGYLIGGHTSSFGNGSSDMYLVKTDANGNEEWSKTFGGGGGEYTGSVIQTSDGGYLLGGTTRSFGNGRFDMYLVKTDSEGNRIF